jgi:hypothetical protein
MKEWKRVLIVAAYVLASPLLAVWAGLRIMRYVRVLRRAVAPALACVNCRRPVYLVGLWQCSCGFAFGGHLMRPCPICGRVPRVVRCPRCRVTTQLM